MPPPSNSEVAWARAAVKQFGSSSPTGVDTGVRMRHPLVAADRPAKGSHQGLGGKYLNCSVSRGGGMARTLHAALSSAEVSSARAVNRRCHRIERSEATSDDERDDGRDDERGRRQRPASKGGGVGRRGVGTAAVRPSLSVQAGRPFVAWGAQMEASAARNGHRGRPRGASSSTSDAAAAAVSSTSRDRVGATRAQDRADVARAGVATSSQQFLYPYYNVYWFCQGCMLQSALSTTMHGAHYNAHLPSALGPPSASRHHHCPADTAENQ
ncbi:hypothetical protein C8R45DRAFT_933464 [Mycena sanguinolenta]|nr:hypothetical protein C8R45DRAFT_933464 [Mycena sanguinolenta]